MRLLWSFLTIILLADAARADGKDDPLSCRPAYCSAALTVITGITDNIDRSGVFEAAPTSVATLEIRADVIPLGHGVYSNLSVLALLQDRLDETGEDFGLVVPQVFVWKEVAGLRWSAAYAPVIILRDLYTRNTATLHDFNLQVKKVWKPPPFLLDSLDLRLEFKERIGRPHANSEHRLTLEAEAVKKFTVLDREFRLWSELRAEARLQNADRLGTRVAYRFTNTFELTTNLTDNLRLTVLKLRREDQVAGPRSSDYGRWDIGAGVRLKFTW